MIRMQSHDGHGLIWIITCLAQGHQLGSPVRVVAVSRGFFSHLVNLGAEDSLERLLEEDPDPDAASP